MPQFQRKIPTVEALTFDELIDLAKANPEVNLVHGRPWHFAYRGLIFTHEADDQYLGCWNETVNPEIHGASNPFVFISGQVLLFDDCTTRGATAIYIESAEEFALTWEKI